MSWAERRAGAGSRHVRGGEGEPPGPAGRSTALRVVRRAFTIPRTEGMRPLTLRTIDRSRARLIASVPGLAPREEIRMLVRYEDALEADWSTPQPGRPRR